MMMYEKANDKVKSSNKNKISNVYKKIGQMWPNAQNQGEKLIVRSFGSVEGLARSV